MKYSGSFILLLLLFALFNSSEAQKKNNDDYRKESEEMRKQIWAWDKSQFKVKEIPARYNTASKIYIARHTELTADSKSKLAFYGFGFGAKREQSVTEIVREMIKLNDKNAISEYSELSFTQFEKASGFFAKAQKTTYVGIRVIKPNGNVKEINADDIVLTKDASAEKKAKVAIPDLQPGDILDYFIASEELMSNSLGLLPYRLLLFNDAPVLSLSFHAQLGEKYALEYRSYNGAPEMKVIKNADKDIIVDVEKTDMPPFETSLWVAPSIQLPFIRMNISMGYKGLGSKALNARRPGEVSKNKDSEEFLDDLAGGASMSYYNSYWMKAAKAYYDDVENDAKKKAKQMGLTYKDLSNDDKAAILFYTIRFNHIIGFNIDELSKKINIGDIVYNGYAYPLFYLFKASGIDPAIFVSNNRLGVRIKETMNSSDYELFTYLPGSNKFFAIQSAYDIPYLIPEDIEGLTDTRSFTFDHPGAIMSMNKMTSLTNVAPGPRVPSSSSDKNTHIENLKLALTTDKNNISVRRSTILRGHYKSAAQRQLILYEDLYESERNSFKEEKSLIETLEDDKKGKKYVEEVKNAFAEARKKQKDAFIKEAKEWFELDITDLKENKTDNLGIRHTSPDFVYSSSFTLNGLVKKAGNNMIVEIGKAQGKPLVVKQEQRKRDIDVYMAFARSIEYNIDMEIPDGYTAEGIASLNKKVENETGSFIVEAVATGKTITIKVKKHYKHSYEPVKNWENLLQIMDASDEWGSSKLLLKKI